MTTETVCVPRELLEWMKEQLPNHVALDGETDLYRRAQLSRLLAQSVASEPVAWVHPLYLKANALGFEASRCRLANAQVPLYLGPPAQTIPAGYALVPIELTSAMLEAGWAEERDIQKNEGTAWDFRSNNRLLNIYRAMLNAAPQPTEGSTDE